VGAAVAPESRSVPARARPARGPKAFRHAGPGCSLIENGQRIDDIDQRDIPFLRVIRPFIETGLQVIHHILFDRELFPVETDQRQPACDPLMY
jgi:hypothetical protein